LTPACELSEQTTFWRTLMNVEKANEIVEWLKKVSVQPLSEKVETVPVKVTLGKHVFYGARFTTVEKYAPRERAVLEGEAKAGEEWLSHKFYLLGNAPLNMRKLFGRANVAFTWNHDLPIDTRVNHSNGEWYVSCYSDKKKPDHGDFFMLGEWLSHSYGFYKDHKIDTLETFTYLRVPMNVEYL